MDQGYCATIVPAQLAVPHARLFEISDLHLISPNLFWGTHHDFQ